MGDPIPLGPEDRAILNLECRTIAGHTCKIVRLAPSTSFDLERLRERVADRIALAPALTCRLGGTARKPGWVPDADFDVAAHVVAAPVEGTVDRAQLLALVARLFEQRLDRSRPLWRIDTVALEDGGSALIWRIHHALADGTASIRYGRALLWDDGPEARMTHAQASAAHATDEARRRAHLAGFLQREYSRGERYSPFDGKIGASREVAFAAVPLQGLHDAAKALDGATMRSWRSSPARWGAGCACVTAISARSACACR
jgi:diacylglycerol O-acyltransferase / wax synthase